MIVLPSREKYTSEIVLDKFAGLGYHCLGSTEISSWKAAGMSSFIHVFEPLSMFIHLPWLPSHNSSFSEVCLLRWVARVIVVISHTLIPSNLKPHTIKPQIGMFCQTSNRKLRLFVKPQTIKLSIRHRNECAISLVAIRA